MDNAPSLHVIGLIQRCVIMSLMDGAPSLHIAGLIQRSIIMSPSKLCYASSYGGLDPAMCAIFQNGWCSISSYSRVDPTIHYHVTKWIVLCLFICWSWSGNIWPCLEVDDATSYGVIDSILSKSCLEVNDTPLQCGSLHPMLGGHVSKCRVLRLFLLLDATNYWSLRRQSNLTHSFHSWLTYGTHGREIDTSMKQTRSSFIYTYNFQNTEIHLVL